MQIQRHARITSIRKVSGYFLLLLSFSLVIAPITGLISFFSLFMIPSGELSILVYLAKSVGNKDNLDLLSSGITLELKVFLLTGHVLLFIGIEYFIFHLHQLVSCYYDGDIFNKNAVSHAKKAFTMNFSIMAVVLLCKGIGATYALLYFDGGNADRLSFLIALIIDTTVWFGLILLALWSLEIGVALNEEVALTI